MYKKLLITAGALALTACGGTKTVYVVETPESTTTTEVAKTTEPPIAEWTEEDEFIYDIETNYGTIYVPHSDLIDAGYMVCDALREGATATDVYAALASLGDGSTFGIAIVGSAVVNFCPEFEWKFA